MRRWLETIDKSLTNHELYTATKNQVIGITLPGGVWLICKHNPQSRGESTQGGESAYQSAIPRLEVL